MSKTIQIGNVPDTVLRRLKARAAKMRISLSACLLNEIEEIAERPTPEEMFARLEQREPVMLTESSEEAVRAVRDSR